MFGWDIIKAVKSHFWVIEAVPRDEDLGNIKMKLQEKNGQEFFIYQYSLPAIKFLMFIQFDFAPKFLKHLNPIFKKLNSE